MDTLNTIKNKLIDKILLTNNEKLLNAIDSIFDSTQNDDKINLSSEQIEMLLMSKQDIKEGNFISNDDLKKMDSGWMD